MQCKRVNAPNALQRLCAESFDSGAEPDQALEEGQQQVLSKSADPA
jgi:hypothetical protein